MNADLQRGDCAGQPPPPGSCSSPQEDPRSSASSAVSVPRRHRTPHGQIGYNPRMRKALVLALAVVAASPAMAQELRCPTSPEGGPILIDRVIGVVGQLAITWADFCEYLTQQAPHEQGFRLPTD